MKYLFFIFIVFVNIQCSAQGVSYTYKDLPNALLPSKSELQPYYSKANNLIYKGYDLTKSLPENHVTNGTIDYTSYLQNGINNHDIVVFPNFPVLINPDGLVLKSNTVLVFKSHSQLIMKPNPERLYGILKIFNARNVSIYFPVLEGDRAKHKLAKGEWGMGIFISGSSNIKIYNPKISNCWGDGIYIGRYRSKYSNNDIEIYYPILDNNRRNGISIVSGANILIESPIISNTHGTNPASGIDVEPNSNSDNIDSIRINNAITYNNEKFGILLCVERLRGVNQKEVNIEINNPKDTLSISGLKMVDRRKNYEHKAKISGKIIINNPHWHSEPINSMKRDAYTPHIIINK